MRERLVKRVPTRFIVLGVWTVLVILCGAFQHRRFELVHRAWRRGAEGASYPFYPVWLLLVVAVLIALGFILLSVRAIAGTSSRQRLHVTIYVGCVCVLAVSNVLLDVARQLTVMRF